MKRIAKILVIIILAMASIAFVPKTTFADIEYSGKMEDSIRSIQKDYFMGVIHKKISSGQSLTDFNGEGEKKRQQINYDIITRNTDKTYSLFDRFGGEVTFPLYLGERVVTTSAIDKVYTLLLQEQEKNIKFDKIIELIKKDNTSYLNKYYPNRPLIKNNGNDPRVQRYDQVGPVTIVEDAKLGSANWYLSVAKTFTNVCVLLVGDKIPKAAFDLIKEFVTTDTWNAIADVIKALYPVFLAFTIFYIVKKSVPVALGKYSSKQLFMNVLGVLVSFGLLTAFIYSPAQLIDVTKKIVSLGDSIAAATLDTTYAGDEIIHSDSMENVVEASIWEDSVFKPWVKGTFGGIPYDQLYTTYANKDKSNTWSLDNNSSRAIGDIGVPINKNKSEDIRNWAALAYSTGSIYHINAVNDKYVPNDDKERDATNWPKADMAATNDYIYRDDFRWIDASLRVGQYPEGSNTEVSSYTNTRDYRFDGEKYGEEAVTMSLLLIPLIIVGWKKTLCTFNLIVAFASIIWRSIANMINPESGEYSFAGVIKSLIDNIKSYFWFTLMIIVVISLYKTLASSGKVIVQLAYLLISIYLCRLNPNNYKSVAVSTFNSVRGFADDRLNSYNDWRNNLASQIPGAKNVAIAEKGKETEKQNDNRNKMKEEEDPNSYGIPKEDIDKYGRNFERNSSVEDIKKEDYDEAVTKAIKYGKNQQWVNNYIALQNALAQCSTGYEVAAAINRHRSYPGNKEMDKEILNIDKGHAAHVQYYNDRAVENFDQSKAREARRYSNRLLKGDNRYRQGNKNIEERLAAFKANKTKISKKDYNSLMKQIKKNNLDGKLNVAQKQINAITGNRLGGSFISLKMKLYIMFGVIVLVILSHVFATIFGM